MTSLCPDVIRLRWAQSAEGCECLGREERTSNPRRWIREAGKTLGAGAENRCPRTIEIKRDGCSSAWDESAYPFKWREKASHRQEQTPRGSFRKCIGQNVNRAFENRDVGEMHVALMLFWFCVRNATEGRGALLCTAKEGVFASDHRTHFNPWTFYPWTHVIRVCNRFSMCIFSLDGWGQGQRNPWRKKPKRTRCEMHSHLMHCAYCA